MTPRGKLIADHLSNTMKFFDLDTKEDEFDWWN